MAEKLDAGARFPNLQLNLVDGKRVVLPDEIESHHAVVLFYRGYW